MRKLVQILTTVLLSGVMGLMLVVAPAEAAVSWDPIVYGTQDIPENGREIYYAAHGIGDVGGISYQFFNTYLQAPTTPGYYGNYFPERYRVYIDLTPDNNRSTYDYAFGFNVHTTYINPNWTTIWLKTIINNNSDYPDLVLENLGSSPANGAIGSYQSLSFNYKGQIGTGTFEWWVETQSPDGIIYDYTNMAVATPIPGAIWLFGSGLAGLLGIGRWRKRK